MANQLENVIKSSNFLEVPIIALPEGREGGV